MRGLPRFTNGQEVNRLSLLAHAEYWVDEFLHVHNLCNKLRYTDDKTEINPRLRAQIPPSHVLEVVS